MSAGGALSASAAVASRKFRQLEIESRECESEKKGKGKWKWKRRGEEFKEKNAKPREAHRLALDGFRVHCNMKSQRIQHGVEYGMELG